MYMYIVSLLPEIPVYMYVTLSGPGGSSSRSVMSLEVSDRSHLNRYNLMQDVEENVLTIIFVEVKYQRQQKKLYSSG